MSITVHLHLYERKSYLRMQDYFKISVGNKKSDRGSERDSDLKGMRIVELVLAE